MTGVANVSEFDSGADRSTTNYDAIDKRLDLDSDPPAGLIAHAAGFSGNTFRIITIWETAEQKDRFERERLVPTLREVVDRSAPPPRMETYELHRLFAPGVLEGTDRLQ
jgi:hypothetical protein